MTMTIPFLNLFKRVKDQALAKKGPPRRGASSHGAAQKPSTERFSKTVMPNATRTLPAVPEQTESTSVATPHGSSSDSASESTAHHFIRSTACRAGSAARFATSRGTRTRAQSRAGGYRSNWQIS